MRGCQDSPVWPEFWAGICLAGHETLPVPTLAAALPIHPSRPFPGSRYGARNSPKQAQVRKRTPWLYSTAYNNSFHVLDVRGMFCVRIIELSYAGNNPVVHGPKHRLSPAYDGVIAHVQHTTQ